MRNYVFNASIAVALGIGLMLLLMGSLGIHHWVARAAGPILYVALNGSDTTDCTNSANPCATIQRAADEASNGAEIRVAAGTYTGVNMRPRNDITNSGFVSQMVYIDKHLTIRGGYTTTNWNTSYPLTQPTTLDAVGQGRVLYITPSAISPTIEGLNIKGGNATGLGGSIFALDTGKCAVLGSMFRLHLDVRP